MPNPNHDNTVGIEFAVSRLQLHLQALETVQLPPFSGSTWRGALGQALRRVVCVCPNTACRTCVMQSVCWYARLYETTINQQCAFLQGYTDAPHPLIPLPQPIGGELATGTKAQLDLLLIGQAQAAVPFLVQAVQRMVAHGVGLDRGCLELTHWELITQEQTEINPWQPPSPPTKVVMTLETPLRLRVHNRILSPDNLEMRPLLTTLLRRISLLACCHSDCQLTVDFKTLAQATAQIAIVERRLTWLHWSRYSSSQDRHIAMDGLVGTLTLDLAQDTEWWPYLWAGQWLHVGKGASMGMGRYTLTC